MTVCEKIKTINNKIKQKILALSFKNVGKYELLPGRDVLPEKGLLEKAV